jgi:ribosome-binding factor A
MAPRTPATAGPSQRVLRVGELVRHALSAILSRGDVTDPVLEGTIVSVPEVKMSPDLRLATCYVMPLGGKDTKVVIEALQRNVKYLRGEVGRRVNLRNAPDLRFRLDETFAVGAHIDAILDSEAVRRDTREEDEE